MVVLSYSRILDVILLLLACSLVDGQEESGNMTFPQSPPLASQQLIRLGGAKCSVHEAPAIIDNAIRHFLQDQVHHIVSCAPEMTGLVGHCPASKEGRSYLSGFYYIQESIL